MGISAEKHEWERFTEETSCEVGHIDNNISYSEYINLLLSGFFLIVLEMHQPVH